MEAFRKLHQPAETSKFQIVVARYNENLDWLLPYSDISIIYNKGNKNISKVFNVINLPNYGRESHTYLYHIINNYDNLADKTIFFQGRIDDHKTLQIKDYFDNNNFTGKINTPDMAILKEPVKHFGKWKDEKISGAMRSCNYIPLDWITNIIGTEMDIKQKKFNTVWCAIFSISRELILKKPKIFYENILRYVDYHPNPEEGHLLERAWYSIFNNNYIPKKVIGYCNMETYRAPEDFDKTLEKYQKLCDVHNLEELHLWFYVTPNYDLGKYLKINNIPVCGKYFIISPQINGVFRKLQQPSAGPRRACSYADPLESGATKERMIPVSLVDSHSKQALHEAAENQSFNLSIKSDNNVNIVIKSDSQHTSFNQALTTSFEFIFGNKCIIFDKKNKNIIAAYDKPIFDKNKFVNLKFDFSKDGFIKVYADDKNIFNKNIEVSLANISEIMIKNNSECDIFLDYDCPDNKSGIIRSFVAPTDGIICDKGTNNYSEFRESIFKLLERQSTFDKSIGSASEQALLGPAEKYRKLKIFLENNYYDIGKNFYYKNYNEYYVNKIIMDIE